MKISLFAMALLIFPAGAARADISKPARYKSPSGRYEVTFDTVTEHMAHQYQAQPGESAHLKPRYLMNFYTAGSSDPLNTDWYADVDPPKSPPEIMASMLWSPGEEFVVIPHGQGSKEPGLLQWLITLRSETESGFQGDHVAWADRSRLISDINTAKIPGGIQVVNAKTHKADLVISPRAGVGYQIAAFSGPRVTVKEFLNHWGDEHEKTTWDFFAPACFDLNLDTLKKRSVACPAQ